jgi:putative FmdB family regulatory protein
VPTYDYACTACGREVEVMHGVHGHGPERCEHCGGPMRKLLSAPTFHFKGSGWAKKDARDSARSSSSATTATKTESKTESKAEPGSAPTGSTAEGAAVSTTSPAPPSTTSGA